MHPGGSAGARAAAAALTVPEVTGGDYESDEEMRGSEFDEDEHDDDGGSDEEYERNRRMDDDMAVGRPPEPPWRRGGYNRDGQRPQGRTGRTNDDVFKTVVAMMNGQQAVKYGLDLTSAATLNNYGELKGGQQPTMDMAMAARKALPATGALNQHVNVDADIAMMGAPAGLAKHVARVQPVLRLGGFYPPKGQLTMLMKGTSPTAMVR